jgi:tRNA (cmo5U34)-methyltransferase
MPKRDQIFADLKSDIEAFQFNESVTAVFADMIRRSMPGYSAVIAMTGVVAGEVAQPDTRIYDLGCSLGTGLLSCSQYAPTSCEFIGVDNSKSMLQQCEKHLGELAQTVQLQCDDIQNTVIENASLVIMNYTLQFIAPDEQAALLSKVYEGLNVGGALLLSEKILFENPDTETTMTDLYYAFKRENGYSELEISQKRSALENVLLTQTEQAHVTQLQAAGFVQVNPWFQCLNFKSFLAIKTKEPPIKS